MSTVSVDARAVSAPASRADGMRGFFALKSSAIGSHLARERPAFWGLIGYFVIEYVRPQSIWPALDVLPWAQAFLLLTVVGLGMERRRVWVSDPAHKWMVMFLLLILASTIFAYAPALSREKWMDFIGWFIVYFLVVNVATTEKRLYLLVLVFIGASFKISLHGARTWATRGFAFTDWGLMGPPGFFENSGELAVQMVMLAPISYGFMLGVRPFASKAKYWGLVMVPVTAVMTVLGASSRGSQLALMPQLLKTFSASRRAFRALVAVSLLGVVGWFALPVEQKARFTTAGNDDTSRQRLLYWKGGVEMIREHPVLGVGYFNFAPYFERYYPEGVLRGAAQLPHNILIQIGTDVGVTGLLVYLMLVIRAFSCTREVRARARALRDGSYYIHLSRGFDSALIGFLIAGQFVTIGYYPFFWIHLALVVAMRNVVKGDASRAAAASVVPASSSR